MKKHLLLGFLVVVVASCSTDSEDPAPASCQPTQVEDFDQASTFYYFEAGNDGNQRLKNISVYDATDSAYSFAYTYKDNLISTIALTDEDGDKTTFTATFDNDKLTSLSGIPQGFGVVALESRLVYSGSNVTEWQEYVSDSQGDLFQFSHTALSYDSNGNLIKSEYYVDFVVIFTIAFGETPTDPYAPEMFFGYEYGYPTDDTPQPLYGQYNFVRPEQAFMKSMPSTIKLRNADGSLGGSIGYEFTYNEQGFPTMATSGDRFIEVMYSCN